MEASNKRIFKNTIYLYIRMLVLMGLSFFSTRIVLDKLGANDYGIQNLVAGFVSMFVVLNNVLQGSTTRFIALSIGNNNSQLQRNTFNTAFILHLLIAVVIVVALEFCGIWFLNNKLNIAPDRLWAARWVFHIAVFQVFWGVTQTPFSASVTAHENFDMYALMSIYDVVAKMAVLFLLVYIPYDKLIIYSVLQMLVSITSLLIYRVYCFHNYKECSLSFHLDKEIAKKMLSFSGWGIFGHMITVVNAQGNSLLLNIFYNTVMNAARGLAQTVSFTIAQFIGGFLTASQPQLVKYWGAGDKEKFFKLIFSSTQYTLFLVAIIGVPVILEIDYVLGLWLKEVPPYTASFVKITVICSLIYRSNTMVDNGINAAGFVKQLNTMSIPIYLLTIPLVYLALKMNWGVIVAYWFASIPTLLAFLCNLWILSKYTGFPGLKFLLHVVLKNFLLIFMAMSLPFIVQCYMQEGFIRFFVICGLSLLTTAFVLYNFGISGDVRNRFKEIIKKYIGKYFR